MRHSYPILDPLLTTVGITILYVPPLSRQKIDLDNLAMRVIPYVRSELKPPATHLHAIQNFRTAAIDEYLDDRLKRLHRVDRIQVTRYQTFELPRLKGDPPAGSVRLILHGRNEFSDPWASCRQAVDLWANFASATER